MSSAAADTRPLTPAERDLAAHMLAHAPEATRELQEQLALASASTWRCGCGCASYDIVVPGSVHSKAGMRVIGDFVFGAGPTLAGAFIFVYEGILGGVEIYGLAGDAPSDLPAPTDLRPFQEAS